MVRQDKERGGALGKKLRGYREKGTGEAEEAIGLLLFTLSLHKQKHSRHCFCHLLL